ncbi:MAG: peptidoglycan-binding protein, partial [Candidatus Pacebacteria bacterium]|nr:peptidoglycan-binding protein [Candidatus Paceibacterota bacterium]
MANFLKSNSAKAVLGLVAFAFAFTSAGVANAYTFTAPTLKVGSRGVQVMELQKALNMCADTSIATGAGSAGYETSTFAGKTKLAVKAWQAKMGLTADGVFGPMSRASMNASG